MYNKTNTSLVLDKDLKKRVARAAAKEHQTISTYIRKAIKTRLKKEIKKAHRKK